MISIADFAKTDPEIMNGEPVFVGTRVPIKGLIDYLAAGESLEAFQNSFPSVTHKQATAALELVRDILREQMLHPREGEIARAMTDKAAEARREEDAAIAEFNAAAIDRIRAFAARHQWLWAHEQYTSFEPDAPSGWSREDFLGFVSTHKWTFARSMPKNPHDYTLRRNTRNITFDNAVRYIREHGLIEYFRGHPYKMFSDGKYKYWTMGSLLSDTILINRKVLAPLDQAELSPSSPPVVGVRKEYLARAHCEADANDFEFFVRLIHTHGTRLVLRGRSKRLDFDGYRYWSKGLSEAIVVNRVQIPE